MALGSASRESASSSHVEESALPEDATFLEPEMWKDLLHDQRRAVKALRRELGKDASDLDDLALLRYVLSNDGDTRKEADKVREMLQWRRENADALHAIADGDAYPEEAQLKRFLLMAITGSLDDGGPVSVVRLGVSDCKGLMDVFDTDQVARALTLEKERLFRICDEATRRTGRIVKAVTVIDMSGFSMIGGGFDKRVLKALGRSSSLSSSLFPQLQARTVAVNAPHFYSVVRSALSAAMPSSAMEKMVVCGGKNTKKRDASAECPFMRQFNRNADAVPPLLGGRAETPQELLPVANRRHNRPRSSDQAPFETATVPARSRLEVRVPVAQAGSVLHFEASVRKHHVLLSTQARPRRNRARGENVNDAEDDDDDDDDDDDADDQDSDDDDEEEELESIDSQDTECGCGSAAYTMRVRRHFGKDHGGDGSSDDAVPTKLASSDGHVQGRWAVPVAGAVLLRFDNGFSRVRSKKVTFRVCVAPPGADGCPSFQSQATATDKPQASDSAVGDGDGPLFSRVVAAFTLGMLLQVLLALYLDCS